MKGISFFIKKVINRIYKNKQISQRVSLNLEGECLEVIKR
jgi:hypothetical protein